MPSVATTPRARIQLVDALRGAALAGICLLHAIGHWSFASYPAAQPGWLATLDARTRQLGLLLLEGKAYAVFALLFGVSFFLILDNWSRRGVRPAGRFVWRLALLGVLGYLHGIVFRGDFLLPIAIVGLPLVLIHRLRNRALAWLAVVLLLQVPMVWEAVRAIRDPGQAPSTAQALAEEQHITDLCAHGSFAEVSAFNAGRGQLARLSWLLESGRFTQMLGLFLCGLLVGRSRRLEQPERCAGPARRAVLWGVVAFAALYLAQHRLAAWGLSGPGLDRTYNLLMAYRNLTQVAVYVGGFVLLYNLARARRALDVLAPYGRMSLTGYVTQGLVGVPLFYGYGLSLHDRLGPFASAGVGIALVAVQCAGAYLWLRRFNYGPLEWLWRCGTFLDFRSPLRRG